MKIIPQNGYIAGEMLGVYEAPRDSVILTPNMMKQDDTEALVHVRVTAVSEVGVHLGNGNFQEIPVSEGAIVVTQAMFLKQFKNTNMVLVQWSGVMALLYEDETSIGVENVD